MFRASIMSDRGINSRRVKKLRGSVGKWARGRDGRWKNEKAKRRAEDWEDEENESRAKILVERERSAFN